MTSLYDMKADPEQRRNVIVEHPDLVEPFRELIRLWKEQMSAPPRVAMRQDLGPVSPPGRA